MRRVTTASKPVARQFWTDLDEQMAREGNAIRRSMRSLAMSSTSRQTRDDAREDALAAMAKLRS